MSAELISGTEIAKEIRAEVAETVAEMEITATRLARFARSATCFIILRPPQ